MPHLTPNKAINKAFRQTTIKTADYTNFRQALQQLILRGSDIKRYGYEWANLWLINTHNGIKGKLPRINVNEYPTIKSILTSIGTKYPSEATEAAPPTTSATAPTVTISLS